MTFLRRFGILIFGIVLMVVGAVLGLGALVAPSVMVPFTTSLDPHATSYGWTAYAPLTNTVYLPSAFDWLPIATAAMVLVGIGLVAGWIGFRVGRRPLAN